MHSSPQRIPFVSCFHYKLHRAHTTLFKETRHGERYVDYCRATEKAWNEPRRLGSWSRVRQKVEWCIRAKIEFLPHATPIYGYSSLKGQLHHHHHFHHLLCFETQGTRHAKRIGGEKGSCGSPSLPREDREYACKVHGRAKHLLNAKNQSRATWFQTWKGNTSTTATKSGMSEIGWWLLWIIHNGQWPPDQSIHNP